MKGAAGQPRLCIDGHAGRQARLGCRLVPCGARVRWGCRMGAADGPRCACPS